MQVQWAKIVNKSPIHAYRGHLCMCGEMLRTANPVIYQCVSFGSVYRSVMIDEMMRKILNGQIHIINPYAAGG